MKKKHLPVLCLFIASIASGLSARTDSDLSAGLIGTWEDREPPGSDTVVGESTYTTDGIVSGYTTATAKYSDGRTENFKVKVRAHWRVEGGILYARDYETEPEGVLPEGYAQKYEIVSLTADEVVFRRFDDGLELHRTRKKAKQQLTTHPGSPSSG